MNIINFLSYVIITAITPGPNNLMSMSLASRYGFIKALPFNIGVFFSFSIIASICAVCGNLISTIIPSIRLPMLILGAAYMLYLAYNIFMSSFRKKEKKIKDISGNLFLTATLLQFINVKAFIYAIVSLEVYILPVYAGKYPQLIFFAVFLAFMGFISTLCWSLFGSVFKVLFSKYAKITNTIMALLLVYCAVALFL